MSTKVGGWTDGELNPRRLVPDATCATTALPDPADWSVSRLPLRQILHLILIIDISQDIQLRV